MPISLRLNASAQRIGIINQQSTEQVSEAAARLSSGIRINKTGDDTAAAAQAQSLSATQASRDKGSDNAGRGAALLAEATEAASALIEITQRIYELASTGATYTVTTTQRSAIHQEIQALNTQFDRITQSAVYNQYRLLNGSFSANSIQVSEQGNAGANIALTVSSFGTGYLGSVSAATVATSLAAQSVSLQAYSTIATQASSLSAQGNRLAIAVDQLAAQKSNVEVAKGRILDIDTAEETARKLKYSILLEKGTAYRAQADGLDENVVTALLG